MEPPRAQSCDLYYGVAMGRGQGSGFGSVSPAHTRFQPTLDLKTFANSLHPEVAPQFPYHLPQISNHETKRGDVVVLATDGLWDNVFESMIKDVVEETIDDPQLSADRLARLAKMYLCHHRYQTPPSLGSGLSNESVQFQRSMRRLQNP